MARPQRSLRTPEAATALAITAVGEPGEVAVELDRVKWLSEPDAGGRWVSHCNDPDRREKFSQRDLVHIFRRSWENGEHEGFAAWAELCGYDVTPKVPQQVLASAVQRMQQARVEFREAEQDAEALTNNPRLLAQMKAAGLKVNE